MALWRGEREKAEAAGGRVGTLVRFSEVMFTQ